MVKQKYEPFLCTKVSLDKENDIKNNQNPITKKERKENKKLNNVNSLEAHARQINLISLLLSPF